MRCISVDSRKREGQRGKEETGEVQPDISNENGHVIDNTSASAVCLVVRAANRRLRRQNTDGEAAGAWRAGGEAVADWQRGAGRGRPDMRGGGPGIKRPTTLLQIKDTLMYKI